MSVESLLEVDRPGDYVRALMALSLAAAMAAKRLQAHARIDRETIRRAIRKLMVGMRVYR